MAVAKKSGSPGTTPRAAAHVRHDLLVRLARAGGQAGQRQRGAHQLEELAAALEASSSIAAPAAGTRGAGTRGTPAVSASSSRLRQYCGRSPRRQAAPDRRDRGPRGAAVVSRGSSVAGGAVGARAGRRTPRRARVRARPGPAGGCQAMLKTCSLRPHVLLGCAVAVEAPLHLQRLRLPERHLVDAPVAGGAADALVHVDAVVEVDEVGQVVDLDPLDRRRRVRKLARTGSSIGLSFQICEWQFMQVLVGGMPGDADFSTEVWQ